MRWEYIRDWETAVDGAVLLGELRDVFRRYVVLPKWGPEMLALWTVHTYAWPLREVTTYVGVLSPEKRCGKTTLLGLLSQVVHKPLASANISPPALFRVIEEAAPTLLIDEADTFLQGNDKMRGILNAGYSRETAYVVRVSGEKLNEEKNDWATPPAIGLARFSCWCPKVMATIGTLPETLADRCIVIRMQRKAAHEECARLKDLDGTEIRRKCARFVNDHEIEIGEAQPEGVKGLNDRAGDIWEPLLAVADVAGSEWPRLAREAAQGLSGGVGENNAIGLLLMQIFVVFQRRASGRIFTKDLVAALNAHEHRPWTEEVKKERIDEYWLANQLRRYGVRPKTLWIQGVIAKGYLREDFEEVFGRYITKADVEEAMGKEERTNNQAPSTGEAPICNGQTGVAAEGPAPSSPVTEESAVAAQTKARREDWRRIVGV